jgi:chitinase
MWSLNRDAACGVQLGLGTVSTVCSGISQHALAFTTAFDTLPRRSGAPLLPPTIAVGSSVADNPATSPYPIWSSSSVYQEGAKVTWHHNVFQAKWYSDGNDLPDAPVAHEWQTPWLDLGPVLPGDRPVTLPRLAPGRYSPWSPAAVYVKGDRVELDGVAYDAKWWTQGDRPSLYDNRPGSSPWAAVIPSVNASTAG